MFKKIWRTFYHSPDNSILFTHAKEGTDYLPLTVGPLVVDRPQLARNQLLTLASLDTALGRWWRLEDVDELQLKNEFCFLMSTLSAKSTNDYHSFNGSGTRLLYFVGSAVTKVQMICEVSRVPALAFCTLSARLSRKYKSLTKSQRFQRSLFVLWRSLPCCTRRIRGEYEATASARAPPNPNSRTRNIWMNASRMCYNTNSQ